MVTQHQYTRKTAKKPWINVLGTAYKILFFILFEFEWLKPYYRRTSVRFTGKSPTYLMFTLPESLKRPMSTELALVELSKDTLLPYVRGR